ncbi:MAG: RNA methyltransferase [Victivallales bacterium]|nr:RNA methyltransferase [Eubacteriales bacterium]
MNYIESRTNDKIKEVSFLQDRKERESKRLFFFEGIHLFDEFIKSGHIPVALFATEAAYDKYRLALSAFDSCLNIVSESVYDKITCEKAPQGVLCVSAYLDNIRTDITASPGGVILESVRDAGNLGGIIRTAASLGVNGITVSRDCADLYSPKTVRAAMGALFSVEIALTESVPKTVRSLVSAGNNVFAACLYGETVSLGTFDIQKNDTFVLGNEGVGVTEETASVCTKRVIIPMSGKTESLNVAAASAVIMWEMTRTALFKERG